MVPCTHGLAVQRRQRAAFAPCCARACLRVPFRRLECPTPCRRRRCFGCSHRQARCSLFFRSCAMASFANCSCNAFAFSIVILNPPSVFWALPVSTQWHIHSECLSSNTNKKARSNSTFCRERTSRFPEKFSEKRLKMPWVKVQVHRICLTRQLASFCHASKNGRKKARKSFCFPS